MTRRTAKNDYGKEVHLLDFGPRDVHIHYRDGTGKFVNKYKEPERYRGICSDYQTGIRKKLQI